MSGHHAMIGVDATSTKQGGSSVGHSKPGLRATTTDTIIGHRADGRPIWAIYGSAPKDTSATMSVGDDDDDQTEDLDEDEDGEDEGDDASTADEDGNGESDGGEPDERDRLIEQLQTRLHKANYEAAQRKRYLRSNGIDPKTGQRAQADGDGGDTDSTAGDSETEGDATAGGSKSKASPQQAVIRRAEERGASRVTEKLMPIVAMQALRAELREAQWTGKDIDRVMRLVDFEQVDVEDDTVVGIAEQVAEIKSEFPEWFRKPKAETERPPRRRGAADVGGTDRGTRPPNKPKSWVERLDSRWKNA